MRKIIFLLSIMCVFACAHAKIAEVPVSHQGMIKTLWNLAVEAGIEDYTYVDATADAQTLGFYCPNEVNESAVLLKGWKMRFYKGNFTLKTNARIILLTDTADLSFMRFFDSDETRPQPHTPQKKGQEVYDPIFTDGETEAHIEDVAWTPEDQIDFLFTYLETWEDISSYQDSIFNYLYGDESFRKMTAYFSNQLKHDQDNCVFKKGCHENVYTTQLMVYRFYNNPLNSLTGTSETKQKVKINNRQQEESSLAKEHEENPVTEGVYDEKKTTKKKSPS